MTKILNEEFAKNLVELVEDTDDMRLTNQYSGRYMYGDLCFGITGNYEELDPTLFQAIRNSINEENNEEMMDLYQNLLTSKRIDNMGMQYIMYFPGWKLPDNIEIEE